MLDVNEGVVVVGLRLNLEEGVKGRKNDVAATSRGKPVHMAGNVRRSEGLLLQEVKELKTKPENDELLEVYGLYKQATAGDNTTGKNCFFKMDSLTQL